MADLVEQLRERAEIRAKVDSISVQLLAAADAIEQLREENRELRSKGNSHDRLFPGCKAAVDGTYQALKKVRKKAELLLWALETIQGAQGSEYCQRVASTAITEWEKSDA